jgi:hypothetical protein
MVAKYVYDPKLRECYLNKEKLPKISENSFKVAFQHQEAQLIIEEVEGNALEISLKNVKSNLPTVDNGDFEDEEDNDWHLEDYGRLVWSEEKEDYILEKGHPKIFSLLVENYKEKNEIEFYFDYFDHLVQKDKDPIKP